MDQPAAHPTLIMGVDIAAETAVAVGLWPQPQQPAAGWQALQGWIHEQGGSRRRGC